MKEHQSIRQRQMRNFTDIMERFEKKLHLQSTGQQHKRRSQHRQQFSSVLLFVGVIILVNLCPFYQDFEHLIDQPEIEQSSLKKIEDSKRLLIKEEKTITNNNYLISSHIETFIEFVKLMFSNPMRLSKKTMRYTQAEARVLGKMAKVWYIKKKIKKLSKKLKKHTIAVPVFTAIPIYEHSYYPQPHVTHVTHGAMHHHAAAASSYVPTVTQLSVAASSPVPASTSAIQQQSQQQQMATSASNNHQVATYRMAPAPSNGHHYYQPQQHNHHHPNPAHQIINAYAPSPPLFVDEAGGLYGHYGNAYGRYDGGYQYW